MAPHEEDEDLIDEEPPTCEPYAALGIEKTATADEIKSAYRKAALKHHPDKAPPASKETATLKFQELAFAYAILSDPLRRKRYDATGSTSESLEADGDFSWAEFYRSQFADIVTSESIEKFSKIYKGGDEEKDDVLAAYEKFKGNWDKLYGTVMLSEPLEDEERYRAWIDEAIESGDVEAYKAFTEETEKQKEVRMKRARKMKEREGKEAMAHAEKLGVNEKLFGNGKAKKESSEDALAALIKSRQIGRGSFLDNLEEKYRAQEKSAKGKGKGKKGKKRTSEDEDEDEDMGMPSEEAFQAAAARLKGSKNGGESEGRKAKRTKR